MSSPYLLMAFLYLLLAILTALDAAFTSFTLLPWFNGLRWLRVHFITLGVLTQVIFGLLPGLVATRTERPRPSFRWDTWAALNAGIVVLLIGIPLLNVYLIFTGGTLVFLAALLLGVQLYGMRPNPGKSATSKKGEGTRAQQGWCCIFRPRSGWC